MHIVFLSIEIWLGLAITSYFGWVGMHHSLVRQRGWHLVFIGFILLMVKHMFYIFQVAFALQLLDEIGMTFIAILGEILIFLGFLKWMPLIVESMQQTQLSPPRKMTLPTSVPNEASRINYNEITLPDCNKQLEQYRLKLQQQAEISDILLENSPFAIIEWDAKGQIKHWSPQAQEVFGWTAPEMVGKHYSKWQFIYEDDEPQVIALFQELLGHRKTQTRQRILIRNYTKDKVIIYCEWHIHVRFNHDQFLSALTFAYNVNTREELRQTLQKNEARWRIIFNNAPIGICIFSLEGYVIKSNLEQEKMLGCHSRELQNRNLLEWTYPEDIENTSRSFKQASSGEDPFCQLENRYVRKDEQIIWANTHFSLVRKASGKRYCMVGMIQNITQRKQAEMALQTAHKNLEFHIENSPLAVIEWDGEFHLQRWSSPAQKMFGWSAEELMGNHLFGWHFVHEVDSTQVAQFIKLLMEGKRQRESLLTRNYHKNGQVLYCQWLISVRFEGNKPGSFLSFVQDVTAREQMRMALQETEEKFHQLAEHIDEVFYVIDLDTPSVNYISPYFENIWEQSREQLLKNPNTWMDSIHPADKKRVQVASENMKQRGTFEEEYRIILPNGTERWVRDRAFPIYNQSGQIHRVAGIAKDITCYKNR